MRANVIMRAIVHRRGRSATRRSGQILVVVAVMLVAMVGILGLVTDSGFVEANRRHAQRAADAAAQAGAREMLYGNGTTEQNNARAAAYLYAGLNGSDTNSYVLIEIPPATASNSKFASSNKFIRVEVSRPVNTMFINTVKSLVGLTTATTIARASATAGVVPKPPSITVETLSPAGRAALKVSGGGSMTVVGGSIYVDSTDTQAVSVDGSSTIDVSAASLNIVGGVDNPGQITGPLVTGATAAPDPFAYVVAPSITSSSSVTYGDGSTGSNSTDSGGTSSKPASKSITGGTVTLNPGIYWGGIKITGGTVTMAPGRYVMAGGGFSVGGSGTTVNGTDIFVYNTQDPYKTSGAGAAADISLAGGANLLAPTASADGYYKGFLIFDDRSITTTIKMAGQLSTGTASPLKGFVYNVNGDLQISGGSGSTGLGAVVKSVSVTGGGSLGVVDKSRVPDVPTVRMVE